MIERRLLQGGLHPDIEHLLVACSGGPDSQALLSVLHALGGELGFRLTAAAVDHGLRAEAAAEIALVETLALRLQVPFVRLQVSVAPGASRQAAARTARYAALLQCAKDHDAGAIAAGHTLDDQAETVLARILRGAGVEGLSGVTPRRADGVIRPLLDCRRALIEAYVAELQLEVARDPGNLDDRYLRVRIRRALLPTLSRENSRLAEQLAHLADDARETSELVRQQVEALIVRVEGRVLLLLEEPPLLRRWVLKLLVERAAGRPLLRTHVMALERMLTVGGQVRVPGDLIVSLDPRGQLAFAKVAKRGRGLKRPTI